MPGPPPPPPPPGPPTGGGLPSDGRSLLLSSIHQGVPLKKTVTNDRSTPITTNNNNKDRNTAAVRSNGGGMAALFAGGMPKLRPTAGGRNVHSGAAAGDGNRRLFPADVKNRGPPPQPPPATQKPALPTSISDGVLHHGKPPPVVGHGKPNLAPRPPNSRPSPPPKKLIVTRAHSMRAPRSPPVAPPFPPQQQRGNPSFHQSQDCLSRTLPRGRPPVRPPPPPPSRPPPPPPSRLAPAPPPTPARNSSMRSDLDRSQGKLEALFSDRFHSVHEFPRPQTFRNINKVYNSVNVKLQAQTSSGKQQAPQPPMLQLGQKMYPASESSSC